MTEENGRPEVAHNQINYDRPGQTDGQVSRSNGVIPPPPTKGKIRTINIRQLDHGYVAEVGCQVFAIENASALITKLSEYILDPAATEAKWEQGKLF